MIIGCDKKVEEGQAAQKWSMIDTIKENILTDEEESQLQSIIDDVDSSGSEQKLAQIYLDNPNSYKTQEIKDFIADHFAKQEEIERQANGDVSLEYSIDMEYNSYGSTSIPKFILKIMSLSDSIEIDHIEVNRGNCDIRKSMENFL